MRLITLIILLFSFLFSRGQSYTKFGSYGYRYNRTITDSVLVIPIGDTTAKGDSLRVGSLVYKSSNKTIYTYDGSRWISVGLPRQDSNLTGGYVTYDFVKDSVNRIVDNKISSSTAILVPASNTVAFAIVGHLANGGFAGAVGTASLLQRSYNAANLQPNFKKVVYACQTGFANGHAEMKYTIAGGEVLLGNETYGGGVKLVMTVCFPNFNPAERIFMGYRNVTTGAGATSTPSNLTNIIALAKDSVDGSTLQFMTNDSSGTATKVNTGITINQNDVYRFTMVIPSNSAYVDMTLERLTKTTITKFTSRVSSNLPAIGEFLYMVLSVSNGYTNQACSFGVIRIEEKLNIEN